MKRWSPGRLVLSLGGRVVTTGWGGTRAVAVAGTAVVALADEAGESAELAAELVAELATGPLDRSVDAAAAVVTVL